MGEVNTFSHSSGLTPSLFCQNHSSWHSSCGANSQAPCAAFPQPPGGPVSFKDSSSFGVPQPLPHVLLPPCFSEQVPRSPPSVPPVSTACQALLSSLFGAADLPLVAPSSDGSPPPLPVPDPPLPSWAEWPHPLRVCPAGKVLTLTPSLTLTAQ